MATRKTKDGTYLVETYIGGRRTRRIAGTLKAARGLEQALRSTPTVPPRGLEEALARHLTGGAKALRDYKTVLKEARALRPFIEGKTLRDAGEVADDIKQALTSRLTNSTINRKLALLRRLCNLAFEWGWTEIPVGRRIKLLPENPPRHVYLSLAEVEALAQRCLVSGNIVRLAAYTGLREGELLRLERRHIQGATIVLDTATKSGRPRSVPVPSVAAALLNDIPFACTYHILRTEFEAARAAIGLPHVRFHDLRHTYASILVQQGVRLKTVGAILGHSSTVVTDRYAHLAPEHLRIAVDGAFTATQTATELEERRK